MKILKTLFFLLLAACLAAIGITGGRAELNPQSIEATAMAKSVGLDASQKAEITFVESVIDENNSVFPNIVKADGKSFYDAEAQAQLSANKYLTYSYVRHFALGLPTVKKGVEGVMDYICSSPVVRLSSYLYVTENSAFELLRGIGDNKIPYDEILNNLNYAGQLDGYYYPVSVLKYLRDTAESGIALLPVIGLKKSDADKSGDKALVFKGYAVMKNNKCVCVLNRELSLAYNIISGQIKNNVLTFSAAELVISSAKCTAQVKTDKSSLKSVNLIIKCNAKLKELKKISIYNKYEINKINSEAESRIKRLILNLVNTAKGENVDLFGLKTRAYISSGGKFTAEEITLKDVPVSVSVQLKTDENSIMKKG